MSFFGLGGKDKYYMGYAASSLFDNSKNIIQEVAIGSIVQGSNLVESMSKDAYPNSLYAHLQHLYNYSKTKYAFGLPNLTVQDKFVMQDDVVRRLVTKYMYPSLQSTDTLEVLYNAIAAGNDIEYYAFKYALDNGILVNTTGSITGAFNTPNIKPTDPESSGNTLYWYDINFTELRYERTEGINVKVVTDASMNRTYTINTSSGDIPITVTNVAANTYTPSGKTFTTDSDTYFFWDSLLPTVAGTATIRAFATHTSKLWEHYSGKFHVKDMAVSVRDIVTTFKSRTDTTSTYDMVIAEDLPTTTRLIKQVTTSGAGGERDVVISEVSSTTSKAPLVLAEWSQDIVESPTDFTASLILRVLDSKGNPKTGWLSASYNDMTAPDEVRQLVTSLSFQPFYPIFPLKRNWEYIDVEDPNPDWLVNTPNAGNPADYTGSVYTALRKMKIDAKDLIKSLKDDDSAKEIIDSYIYFATDVLQDNPRLNVYFYKYFMWLKDIIPGAGLTGEHTFVVSDDTFKTSYKFRQISHSTNQGVVARKLQAVKTISDVGDITVKYQVSDSTYEEVTIYGLRMFNSIYAGKKDGVEVSVHNWAVDSEDNKSPFLLPLSMTVLKELNARTKEIVIKYSCKLVCYTQHKQHIKWYQTGWFSSIIKVVMLIVSIVISYFTGPQNGMTLYQFVTSLTVSQIAALLLVNALKAVLLGAILTAVMNAVLVPLFGTKLALIFTIAAMAYGMMGNTGFDLPFATDVTQLAGPALNAALGAYTEEQMGDIADEYAKFKSMVADRQQDLKDAAAELGMYKDSETNERIDPFGFGLNVDMCSSETPQMYLLRKSTNASLALTGYEYVQAYYVDKLSLG